MQQFPHPGPGGDADFLEIVAGDQGLRPDFLLGKLRLLGDQETVDIQLAVAGGAVDTVEFQFLGKSGAGEEAFEGADAHLGGVLERHVVGDAGNHRFDLIVGKAKPPQNLFRHARPHALVAKEADATRRLGAGGAGFADVVQERGERQHGGGIFQVGKKQPGMDPDIALRMMFGRLGAAAHFKELGDPDGDQAGIMQEIQAAGGVGAGQDFDQLLPDALGGEIFGFRGQAHQGFPSRGLDLKAQLYGEADGPEQTKPVLAKAGPGIPDGADRFGLQIGPALHKIQHLVLQGIEKHAVDGEVATFGILLRCGESDGGGAATVEVGSVNAEGGDFKNVLALFEPDHAKGLALGIRGLGKNGLDLIRRGGRGDIDIRISAVEQGVPDAAPGVDGLVPGLMETAHNVLSLGVVNHFLSGDFKVRYASPPSRLQKSPSP